MTAAPTTLANTNAPYTPDANDLIVLDGVALGIAAAVVAEAYPGVEAGGDNMMRNAEMDRELALRFLQAVRQELEVSNLIADSRLQDGVTLDRAGRNALRSMCFLLLGRPLAKTDPLRLPERLLEAIGPFYEPETGGQ
jgi:hypothetical protein